MRAGFATSIPEGASEPSPVMRPHRRRDAHRVPRHRAEPGRHQFSTSSPKSSPKNFTVRGDARITTGLAGNALLEVRNGSTLGVYLKCGTLPRTCFPRQNSTPTRSRIGARADVCWSGLRRSYRITAARTTNRSDLLSDLSALGRNRSRCSRLLPASRGRT